MMWKVFIESLVLLIGPLLIPFCLLPRLRKNAFFNLPLGLVFYLGSYGVLSAAFYGQLEYGWRLYLVLSILSSGLAAALLLLLSPHLRTEGGGGKVIFGSGNLLWLAGLALLAVGDTGLILSKQGWSLPDFIPYFRPPLSNDLERHVLVINALLRHSGSPFVPHTEFLYQLFWHHWAATLVCLFPAGATRYPIIAGLTLSTGFLFFFVFLWMLYVFRPFLFRRRRILFVLFPLLFAHADLYNFAASLLTQGKAGIEADWSFKIPLFFRCFTLKLVSLTAPQHGNFLLFLSMFLVARQLFSRASLWCRTLVELLSFQFAFIASPLVTAFVFLPYAIVEWWGRRKIARGQIFIVAKWVLLLGIGMLGYFSCFGYWPQALIMRPGTSELIFFPGERLSWYLLPFLFIGMTGTLGLLLMGLIIFPRKKRTDSVNSRFIGAVLLVGALGFHYGVTDLEVRRHFAIIASFFGSLWVFLVFPRGRQFFRVLGVQRGASALVVLTVFLHGYFLYSYMGKPSVIQPNMGWKDYFTMNSILKTKYPGVPVVGLSDPNGTGIEYPIAQEVTTSFSIPAHTVIHTKLTWDQFRLLRRIMYTGEVLPHAGTLGYRYIVWGPVEERGWGARSRKRFLKESHLVERVGSVFLYRYVDNLKARFEIEPDKTSPDFYLKVADAFAAEGWKDEAMGYYYQAVKLKPNLSPAHEGLARLLQKEQREYEAKLHFDLAKRTGKLD